MTSFYDTLRLQAKPFETKVKTLLNSDLKTICKEEGLQVSGVKAVLQARVLERLNDAIESGDVPRLHEICRRINRFGNQATSLPSMNNSAPRPSAPPQHAAWSPAHQYGSPVMSKNMSPQHSNHIQTMFKQSPFYKIKENVTAMIPLPVMTSARHTAQTSIRLNTSQVDMLAADRSLRFMAYCFVDYEPIPRDITFPNQVELKVNGETFQGNLRGLKKKPGTTKPADIHNLIHRSPNFTNSVSLAYAATDKKFSFVVCIVKKTSVEELTERIKRGHFITKQAVINEMISKAKDPDIVATSTVMSLKCPLSATRMVLPCRSTICNHNQCFDASSFLQLQEQAPVWSCPICNKTFGFESLVVDQFVQDILESVSRDTEQITLEPNGSWKPGTQNEDDFRKPNSAVKRKQADAFDLDGSSPIEGPVDSRLNGLRAESVSTPQSYARTPTFSSREPSTSASTTAPRSSTSKRPAEEVIDLTLSDDDDEEDQLPRRPAKRQFTGDTIAPSQTMTNNYSPVDLQRPMQNFQNRQPPPSLPSQNHRPISITMPPKPPPTPQFSPGFNDGYGTYGRWQ